MIVLNIIKRLYRGMFSERVQISINDIRRYFAVAKKSPSEFKSRWQNREVKKCFGRENPDKTFYVIRRDVSREGHFSVVNYVLGGLYRAELYGYIPVVDMKNYYSPLWQSLENKGKNNAWEYFYSQPGGYTLEEISKSKNVILCDLNWMSPRPDLYYDIAEMDLLKWGRMYEKYIHISPAVQDVLTEVLNEHRFLEYPTIGISIRRGVEWGYLRNQADYMTYPFQNDLEGWIALIKQKMNEWGCTHVFVSIDDDDGLKQMLKCFGTNLIYIKRKRRKYFENGLPLTVEQKVQYDLSEKKTLSQEEIFERESRYLVETILLSKCKCLISTKTSTNAAAMIMNGNKYEHVYEL